MPKYPRLTSSLRASTTASVSASIMDYRTIHGRTFHSERHATRYWGPNDERQAEAMDINHHVLTLLLGGRLHLAPIPRDVGKVLDVGTGTGIWAIDFADEYPNAQVLGTDLSPIQPYWIPVNCKFEIDDAELPWTWSEGTFDYVHIRYLVGAVADWPRLFRQAYAALKPGGWIESFEPDAAFESDDGTLSADSELVRWATMNREGGRQLGRPFAVVSDNLQLKGIQEAGFTDITVRNLKVGFFCCVTRVDPHHHPLSNYLACLLIISSLLQIPISPWPADPHYAEIGQYEQFAIEQDLEGMK